MAEIQQVINSQENSKFTKIMKAVMTTEGITHARSGMEKNTAPEPEERGRCEDM